MDIQRQHKFLDLYKEGLTLEAIGKLEGLTRERIRQIISGPEYEVLKARRKALNLEKRSHSITCFCGNIKRVFRFQQFCSKECRLDWNREKATEAALLVKEKTCTRCKQIKPIEEFYKISKSGRAYPSLGRYGRCRTCHLERTMQWVKDHPTEALTIQRRATKAYMARIMKDPVKLAAYRKMCKDQYEKLRNDPAKVIMSRERLRAYYYQIVSTPEGRQHYRAKGRRAYYNIVNDPERFAKKLEYRKQYYLKNKARISAYAHEQYLKRKVVNS